MMDHHTKHIKLYAKNRMTRFRHNYWKLFNGSKNTENYQKTTEPNSEENSGKIGYCQKTQNISLSSKE